VFLQVVGAVKPLAAELAVKHLVAELPRLAQAEVSVVGRARGRRPEGKVVQRENQEAPQCGLDCQGALAEACATPTDAVVLRGELDHSSCVELIDTLNVE